MYNWAYDSLIQKWIVLIGDVVLFGGTYEEVREYLKGKGQIIPEYKENEKNEQITN